MQLLEVSGAVRHIYIYIYIYVIRRLRVKLINLDEKYSGSSLNSYKRQELAVHIKT